jgi:hypothetical protein
LATSRWLPSLSTTLLRQTLLSPPTSGPVCPTWRRSIVRPPNGTEITEYRDKGKPVEINVKSNFGTRYQMSAPADTSPTVRDNGRASTRLPSVHLSY